MVLLLLLLSLPACSVNLFQNPDSGSSFGTKRHAAYNVETPADTDTISQHTPAGREEERRGGGDGVGGREWYLL